MIQPNKMIYQPPKYHSNSFTHFLQLHSTINSNSLANSLRTAEGDEQTKLELHDSNSNTSNTSLEVVNESIGKSFTIAAILGLKKNSVDHMRQNCESDDGAIGLTDYNTEFPNLINLSHTKLFQKFDNDNRHNYMLSPNQQPTEQHQMPIEQCIYDNNTTSNSSYQDHLHKHINTEFNVNYNRNANDPAMNTQTDSSLRNHMHQHVNNNLLNKAFNRDRNRMG